ncbi:MAG: flavin reductase family protein [Planctomycetota bacterium]
MTDASAQPIEGRFGTVEDPDRRGDLFAGSSHGTPSESEAAAIVETMSRFACDGFVMTSSFEGDRAGTRALSVQPAATQPLLVCVAVRKGHAIEPLIRDSRVFGLCLTDPGDRLLSRKFPIGGEPAGADEVDVFDSLATFEMRTKAPLLDRSPLVLDCEVVRHFDLEADHELYVGLVLGGRSLL